MLSALNSTPLSAAIAPQSVAAGANVTSAYVDARKAARIAAFVNLGALGGGAVTVDFLQATSAAGADSKALTAGGFAQVAGLNTNASTKSCEGCADVLDGANGFAFVAVKLSVVGGTGALVGASLHSVDPDYK